MPSYKAPVEDVLFLLNDVFDYARYSNLPRFSDASIDVVEAILNEGGKFAEEVLLPLNRVGDLEGCKRADDGTVTTPKGFKEAYKAYVEGGWVGISGEPRIWRAGPAALPRRHAQRILALRQSRLLDVSRASPMARPRRSQTHASDELKAKYLPKLTTGEWTGTMNLTEPHCGTDLGLLKTKATPNADGSYAISGQKIFISSGEHDLADNIIHLVLARIEGAPAGVKGISLFLVPKVLVNEDGSLGRAQQPRLRRARAQDGHPRQRDLRDELRRREGLAGRRGEPRPQRDVRDDERRAARRRRAGPRPVRGRLPERRGLREGAPAGPLADRRRRPRKRPPIR